MSERYDPASGDLGICGNCGRPIHYGQSYMPRIPFVAGWQGFSHQFCPPRLIVTTEGKP